MTFPAAILLALSLSMDSFAAALSRGAAQARLDLGEALRVGVFFGAFQTVAPLAGWMLGMGFAGYLAAVDHWIAFALLAGLGAKLIRDGLKGRPAEAAVRLPAAALAGLALATSIDATAAGVSLSLMSVDILAVAGLVGAVTFAAAVGGAIIGPVAAPALGRHAMMAGGLGLFGLGVKILIDHNAFG
ncbi:MAG: manganese efflux pump [Rhodospirillaceae bacterium]|nr:manganese efflux pump [Rhodospirillaceae bacterium]